MGIAVRNAERLGYQRDGTLLQFSPLETEERRRIWWQMQQQEVMIAQSLGCASSSLFGTWDSQLPSNLEDEDFSAGMTVLPRPRPGLTSMSHCLWRYSILHYCRQARTAYGDKLGLTFISSSKVPRAERDASVSSLEQMLNERFVQYCEPIKPLQWFIQLGVRSVILTGKRVARQPGLVNVRLSHLSATDRDELLDVCNKSLEYFILGQENPVLQPYMWHWESYFQWTVCMLSPKLRPLIMADDTCLVLYVIFEAHRRQEQAISRDLWALIDRTWAVHPKLSIATDLQETTAHIGRLTLHAWLQREDHFKDTARKDDCSPPACIDKLQRTFCIGRRAGDDSNTTDYESATLPRPTLPMNEIDPFEFWDGCDINLDTLDWSQFWNPPLGEESALQI